MKRAAITEELAYGTALDRLTGVDKPAPAPVPIPREERTAAPTRASLIKLSDLKDASLAGDQTSILRNGRLGVIDTFTLYKSNLLATTTDGANTCTNMIFGINDAITFATQLTENESLKNPFGFGTLFRGLQVYGYKVVKAEAMGWLYAYKG